MLTATLLHITYSNYHLLTIMPSSEYFKLPSNQPQEIADEQATPPNWLSTLEMTDEKKGSCQPRPSERRIRQKATILLLGSQLVAAALHALAKTLETGPDNISALQLLQVRLSLTAMGSSAYLSYRYGFRSLLGPRSIRPLLIIRALAGVAGSIGFYCMTVISHGKER